MSWLDKILPSRIQTADKKQVPDDLWSQCDACEATIYTAELLANQRVCPKCGHHMRVHSRARLEKLFDENTMVEIAADIKPVDKLKFKDSKTYKERIKAAQKSASENDALVAFSGELMGKPLVASAFEFSYMGGSMGSVVGEKFVRSVEKAIELNAPFVCFSASGGARMQEGLISLMQMAKTSAALTRLSEKKLPFISVLTDPTMGGVSASFAMLGDLILAEPKALVGFAGPRVIEQTVREVLPEGFQRSEFLLEKGAIDKIVDRREMRDTLASVFSALMPEYTQPITAGAGESVVASEAAETNNANTTLDPAIENEKLDSVGLAKTELNSEGVDNQTSNNEALDTAQTSVSNADSTDNGEPQKTDAEQKT